MTTTLYAPAPYTAFESNGYRITQAGTAVPDGLVQAIVAAVYQADGVLLTSSAGGTALVQVGSYYNPGTGAPTADSLPAGSEVKDSTGAVYEKKGDGTWAASGAGSYAPSSSVLSDVATVITSAGALTVGKHNPVNAAGGSKAMTLANAGAAGLLTTVEKTDSSANTVTITLNLRGTPSSTLTLYWQNESVELLSKADGSWWPVAGHKTKASIDAEIVSVGGGTFAALAAVPALITGLIPNDGSGTTAAANTATANAALTAAQANLGTGLGGISSSGVGAVCLLPPGKFYFDGVISVPNAVDLIGAGRDATALLGYSSTSKVQFGSLGGGSGTSNYGGTSGRFRLEGRNVATTILHIGLATSRHFEDINVQNCAGDNIVLEQTQNCAFMLVDSYNAGASNIVLDYGAGGNAFYKCEFTNGAYANGQTRFSGVTTGGGYAVPTHNLFSHCLFEGVQATAIGSFLADATGTLFFQSTVISLNPGYADLGGASNIPALRVKKISGNAAAYVQSVYVGEGCRIDGSKPAASTAYVGVGIQVETAPVDAVASVYLAGGVVISKCDTAIRTIAAARIDVQGRLYIFNCTNRFGTTDAGAQTEASILLNRMGAADLTADDPAKATLTVRANASQTANVLQTLNTGGGVAFLVTASGSTSANTATASRFSAAARGTNSTPAWGFGGVSDTNTGFYSQGAGDISFVSAATERIRLNGTGIGFNGVAPVAKAASPGTATGTDAAVINAVVTALRNLGLVA